MHLKKRWENETDGSMQNGRVVPTIESGALWREEIIRTVDCRAPRVREMLVKHSAG
jgi:hypothetical protein